ncbi:MAG: 16S rRNA (guanine(527)-N(7))-methyltransferase RsmG [Bacilli bacterium]|nr:16S rRNA (guanine(527)-N(7))-methyltransferase RsmG [Bacilli bacterium]
MNKDIFIKEINKLGVFISENQYEKLEKYCEFLIQYNEKINLTSIVKKEDIFLKHFYDSLTIVKAIDLNKKINLCDFGTGAGFPGVVIKIFFDEINLTLIESSSKKIIFLEELIKKLDLKKIKIEKARVEEYKKEKFDLVTCRAVSRLSVISEICCDIVKINGYFIPMKADIEQEINNINRIDVLGFKLENIIKFKLPIENSVRSLVVLKKIKQNKSGYPRNYKKIINNPLF